MSRQLASCTAATCTPAPAILPRRQGTCAESPAAAIDPRFGHDFGRVRIHSTVSPIIQRFPDDGASMDAEALATPELDAASSDTVETPPAGLIVEDSAEEVGPEQMRKSEFLSRLSDAVATAAADLLSEADADESGSYIDSRLEYYNNQDSAVIEQDIHQFAPATSDATSAADYIPLVADGVRQALVTWNVTGEAPEQAPPAEKIPPEGGPGGDDFGLTNVLFKGDTGGPRRADDPRAIQARLGPGTSLDGGVRSRMEPAFGYDFSRVRVHADDNAAALSGRFNALAFTVGEHVAFGREEYRPGSLIGDALIAHELAHVVQQDGAAAQLKGETSESALEEDADWSAIGAVASLWGMAKGALGSIARNVAPSLRSGLRLGRCCSSSICDRKSIKSIDVDIFEFEGRALDPTKEIAGASAIWKAGAGIQFNALTHPRIGEPEARTLIGQEPGEATMPVNELSLRYSLWPDVSNEVESLHAKSSGGKGSMTAFFVPSLRGILSPSAVDSEPGSKIAYIGRGRCDDGFTLAHELGHLLIDPSRSVHGHGFASSLMTTPACSTGIDCDECGIARSRR
jgi:hypothetical protein